MSKKFVWPKRISGCGGDGSIERVSGSAAWRCVVRDSSEMAIRRLTYFASVLDIEGLGEQTVRLLVEEGFVEEYADIFTLTVKKVLTLPGFKEKSATNLIHSINASRQVPVSKMLSSLSIDGVGEEVAILLAEHLGTFEGVFSASVEDLQSVRGFGEVLANTIVAWGKDKKKQRMLTALLKQVECVVLERKQITCKFTGKRVVITGRVGGYGREEVRNLFRSCGASVSESVSEKTDYLVCGEDAGSKLKKARDFGVKVVSGEEEVKEIVALMSA